MVNSTRASQKAKDEENGRVTRSSEKAKINAHPNVLDTDSIRKSTRETPLRKTNASTSNTQKSEQVEKGTLPAPEARRKSERVEKMKTQSPLTKSGKTKNPSSSSSPSDSKSAGSLGSISRQKLQKEKSVKQLTFEAQEVAENEEHNVGTSHARIKRMDARMYRSLFKDRKKGTLAFCIMSFFFANSVIVYSGTSFVSYPNLIQRNANLMVNDVIILLSLLLLL
jgi:Ca2+-dependent lipid-binding protein